MQTLIYSRKTTLWLLPLLWASSVNATVTTQVDQLTQQWLEIAQQTSRLESDWQIQQPLLQQRLTLLAAEKAQLQTMLQTNNDNHQDVDARRAEMLAQQAVMEQQQQQLEQSLQWLVAKLASLHKQLPPPLAQSWQKEQSTLSADPETSTQLQVSLAQLSRMLEFEQRISLHTMPITTPEGKTLQVKQLYLGVGSSWFVSADGNYAGWGQAQTDGWQWHFDHSIAEAVSSAIAIFEKKQPAQWVELPLTLSKTTARVLQP